MHIIVENGTQMYIVGLASDVDKRRYTWKVSRLFATQKRRFT